MILKNCFFKNVRVKTGDSTANNFLAGDQQPNSYALKYMKQPKPQILVNTNCQFKKINHRTEHVSSSESFSIFFKVSFSETLSQLLQRPTAAVSKSEPRSTLVEDNPGVFVTTREAGSLLLSRVRQLNGALSKHTGQDAGRGVQSRTSGLNISQGTKDGGRGAVAAAVHG